MTGTLERLKAALADRYRIERELGQGGMATVYLADDLKHDRKVAIKVLRPELAAVLGAERFVQEIKTTAALQHPHILPLFDSGEAGGFLYYVMPYIEGETIREKLTRETQFGIDEAVKIATEVADALDYAHQNGVIHRDIKPENILLHNGRPMVMDFGIALAVSAAAGGRMTETGLSLGTPHYMSPEQATAEKELSARSDVYSLASVLYEMLTGNPPHVGANAQQIIMKIVTEEAEPVTSARKTVPANVAAAVAKSLEKLPADRFASAKAFADALGNAAFTTPTASGAPATPQRSATQRHSVGTLALAGVALVAVIVAAFGWLRPVPREVMRVGLIMDDDHGLFAFRNRQFALAPDGSSIVYPSRTTAESARQLLWIRDFSSPTSRALPGTEGGVAPFFSPDGRSVAFIAEDQLRVVPVDGGNTRTLITDSVMPWGGAWSGDDWLYVTMGGRLHRVRGTGGAVELVSTPDSNRRETFHEYPDVHPNNDHVLIQLWIQTLQDTEIGVLSLETGEVRVLGSAVVGRFIAGDRIAYVTYTGDLLVAPYDEDAMAFAAPGTVVERNVQMDDWAGTALYGISRSGHLVYAQGREQSADRLVWVDRRGEVAPLDADWTGPFTSPRLSPDGRRIAVVVISSGGGSLWTADVSDGLPQQLTFDRLSTGLVAWSPDGREIAYTSRFSGTESIWTRNADGSGQPTEIDLGARRMLGSLDWAPSGHIAYEVESVGGDADIHVWHPDRTPEAGSIVQSSGAAWAPDVSPDGRWLAYVSDESGRNEVYVTRFPDGTRDKWRVSNEGGAEPVWARDGRELFYRTEGGELVARRLELGDVVRLGSVEVLFDASGLQSNPFERDYDVTPDGQRFLMIQPGVTASTLQMVVNWTEELKALDR